MTLLILAIIISKQEDCRNHAITTNDAADAILAHFNLHCCSNIMASKSKSFGKINK